MIRREKTDIRREVIIKGVKDVETALKHIGEADRALIFSRIIEQTQRFDAADALTLLSKRAERKATALRSAARRVESDLADPTLDPRPEMVLQLKKVSA